MTGNEPPRADPAGTPADELLRQLERRLDAASEAAERLFADAAERVAGRRPPAAGWQTRPASEASGSGSGGPWASVIGDGGWIRAADAELLLSVLAGLRDRIPPDLQQRLAAAVREVLLAIRALIDWYLEHSERGRRDEAEVEEIPIL